MSAYVIMFAGRRMLGWNRHSIPPENFLGGWRPHVWTASLLDAEKFGSETAAALYGRGALQHDEWRVVHIPGDPGDCA